MNLSLAPSELGVIALVIGALVLPIVLIVAMVMTMAKRRDQARRGWHD